MKLIKKVFARQLRKEQTETEKTVWQLLRDRKCSVFKFRRQHVIEGFVVDFYCHTYNLAIEIDGGVHDKQKEYDEIREDMLKQKNVSIIRIKAWQIVKDKNIVVQKINNFITKNAPSPSGRGTKKGK